MSKILTCIVSGAMLSLASASAHANIVCRDGYQVLPGGKEIATPYCDDATLGEAARAAGSKVSDNEIRNNPGVKDSVCRWLGNSAGARDACPDSDDGDE